MNSSAEFFNDFAERFDAFYDKKRCRIIRWVDQHFRRDMFMRFAMTFEFLGDLTGGRILDIGCGPGFYIAEALRRGAAHVTGIDPAPKMLTLAKKRISQLGMLEKVAFIEGQFPQDFPQGSFDFAIVMGVMDYVGQAPDFLRSLRTIVTKGAVLSFPSTHWLRTPFRKIRYRLRNCPVYFYTSERIKQLMQEAGIRDYRLSKIPGAGMDYILCLSV